MGDMIFIFDESPLVIPFVFAEEISMELVAESERVEGVVTL